MMPNIDSDIGNVIAQHLSIGSVSTINPDEQHISVWLKSEAADTIIINVVSRTHFFQDFLVILKLQNY